MCGIIGIIKGKLAAPIHAEKFNTARDTLLHRGPDAGDSFFTESIALGHRRLSIIDLNSHSNQPMHFQEYTIVFNGEIYNYQQLREQLQTDGVAFITKSDTEVLLHMYIQFGASMLHQLEGMFAFAIYNNHTKKLFIARDRVGMKPLYYTFFNNNFLFASEPKAFFVYGVPLEINEQHLAEMQMYRHVSGGHTLFNNIEELLPGYQLTVTDNLEFSIQQWWNLKERIQQHEKINNPAEWFKHHVNDSVKKHMIADVPVGVLLSGGLDSSSVVASLYEQGFENINTYTMGFKDYENDETHIAKQLTQAFNYTFNGIYLEGINLVEALQTANSIFDEPLMHQNEPHLISLSQLAKKNITVLLSGEGADEFLGGYVRYKPLKYAENYIAIKKSLAMLPGIFKTQRLKKLEAYFSQSSIKSLLLSNAVHFYEADFDKLEVDTTSIKIPFREKILADAQSLYPTDYRRQMMYIDQHTYLYTLNARNDRSTMAASIECRIPFLHHPLIEGLGTLESDWFFTGRKGKYILKQAYQQTLTKTVTKLKKIGFSVPWLQLIQKNPYLKQQWDEMETSAMVGLGLYKYLNISSLKKQAENSNNIALQQYVLSIFFSVLWYNQYTKLYQPSQN